MTTLAPRATTYRGIQMRSRLEASYAQWLDTTPSESGDRISWKYEPECFADESGQYLPDFLVTGWPSTSSWDECLDRYSRLDGGVYVEIKPTQEAVAGAKRAMDIIRSNGDRRGLAIVVPWGGWPNPLFYVAARRPPNGPWRDGCT